MLIKLVSLGMKSSYSGLPSFSIDLSMAIRSIKDGQGPSLLDWPFLKLLSSYGLCWPYISSVYLLLPYVLLFSLTKMDCQHQESNIRRLK